MKYVILNSNQKKEVTVLKYEKILSTTAPAKINLFLDIESKRPDGYHNIKSIMQTVSLCDKITLQITEDASISKLTCSDKSLPCDERNLANKAVSAFKRASGLDFGAIIEIEKNIPSPAGLGGGSADAAAVLNLLNELTGMPLSYPALADVGAKIGADVPFCLKGGTAIAGGIGEKLEPISAASKLFLVIAVKGNGISTPLAYKELDIKFNDFEGYNNEYANECFNGILTSLSRGNIKDLCKNMFNIFEPIATSTHENINILKSTMLSNKAIGAMMSGSGPAVFGIFEAKADAEIAKNKLCSIGAKAFVCETI